MTDTQNTKTRTIMNIDDLTIGQLKDIQKLLTHPTEPKAHPMLGRRCVVRTYSAGVHIGDVAYVNGSEAKLENALRLWSWKDGGLSLSAVANNGIKGGRLNKTGEVYLTNVIELIPVTQEADATYAKFIED